MSVQFPRVGAWLRQYFNALVLLPQPTSLKELFDLGIDEPHVVKYEVAQIHSDVQRYNADLHEAPIRCGLCRWTSVRVPYRGCEDQEDGDLVPHLDYVVEVLYVGQVLLHVNQMPHGHHDLEECLHGWVGAQKGNRETVEHTSYNEEEVEYVSLWSVSTNVLRQCSILPLGLLLVVVAP